MCCHMIPISLWGASPQIKVADPVRMGCFFLPWMFLRQAAKAHVPKTLTIRTVKASWNSHGLYLSVLTGKRRQTKLTQKHDMIWEEEHPDRYPHRVHRLPRPE